MTNEGRSQVFVSMADPEPPTPTVSGSPLSAVPVPMVSHRTGQLAPYARRDPSDYSEAEREQIFVALARRLARLKEQHRASAALDLIVVAAAVSPTTSKSEVEALALWRWTRSNDDYDLNRRIYAVAEERDRDVNKRHHYLLTCLDPGWEEGKGLTALDAIRLYWDFPEHYMQLLDDGGSLEQRVQDLTSELSGARKAAAELSRQALELLTEATRLENTITGLAGNVDSPAVVMAREQVTELREEVDRLTAAAQDYRTRAELLLGTLNAIKPGYENHDGTPTARVVLPMDIQRQVHDRDGGRCVKCGSTFKLQIDHVVPLSKGGSNDVNNLQVLCMACNTAKGDRYIG